MYPYEVVGNAKVFEGEYRDAILFFERAIAIHPSSSTYSNLGVCYFYLRDFKQAAANYERASQIEGAEPEVFGNIGEAYFLAGDMEKARPALLKALDLAQAHIQVNPKSVDDLQAAAQYHSMLGEREAALDSMNRALKISSAPDVLLKAAVVRVHLGEPQQAIPWLQRALKAGLQPALIRDDPTFDGMRNDPAFVGLNLGPK